MSNLVKRTLSGIIFISVIIAAVVVSQPATYILFLAFTILSVNEYHKLVKSDKWITIISIASACCLFMSRASAHSWWWFAFVLLLIIALAGEVIRATTASGAQLSAIAPAAKDDDVVVSENVQAQAHLLQNKCKNENNQKINCINSWGNILISQVMIALPFSLTADILHSADWEISRWIMLAVFVCIWSNDTGAYLVGSLIGKHKLIPKVSPGKTWEGLIGGFIFSILAGYIFSLSVAEFALWQWLLFAFTISLFGTFGDLMESLLKRTIGVKDSGNFMPGHGGILDRFDSFLLATPAVYLLIKLFVHFC